MPTKLANCNENTNKVGKLQRECQQSWQTTARIPTKLANYSENANKVGKIKSKLQKIMRISVYIEAINNR